MIFADPPLLARAVLVLGGARSGKSRYAQALAEGAGKSPVLVATARVEDEEMSARISRHRAERGAIWQTIEEPMQLQETLHHEADQTRILLVDCLTLWLSNIMLAGRDEAASAAELTNIIPHLRGPVIFVTNEVGNGIVPENALARRFRDAQGRLNQAMAAACDAVVLVTAGLPRQLKPAPLPSLRF
jgi:adenosylcobinamide kinase/adenosylcobinamide-phosphate guanylyltransferase